jgi:hypothetical protein
VDEGLLVRAAAGAVLRRDQFYDSAWRPALRGAGLARHRFTFHTRGHFCASRLLAEGGRLSPRSRATSATQWRRWAAFMSAALRDDRDVPAALLDRVLSPAAEDLLRTEGGS